MITTKPLGLSEFNDNKALWQRTLEYRKLEVTDSFVSTINTKQIRVAKLAKRGGYILKETMPKAPPLTVDHQGNGEGRGILGLSNVSKMGISNFRTQIIVSPGNVKIKIQDKIAYMNDGLPHLRNRNTPERKPVTEFTSSSKMNMMRRINDIEGLNIKPDFMLTLTYPGKWLECIKDGAESKKHLIKYRDRLRKHLQKQYGMKLSFFWFLEFQSRGAPHYHLLLCLDKSIPYMQKRLQIWSSRAWCKIVNHPDSIERNKHLRAGSRVEKMRKKHFGYARKYASKQEQKQAPEGWLKIGRFWGFYGVPKYQPLLATWYSENLFNEFMGDAMRLANAICKVAPNFSCLFLQRVSTMYALGKGYGSWTFHGRDVVNAYVLPKLE